MKDEVVWEIVDSLVGHCAMESVTGYVVKDINERYGTNFANTSEMLEAVQKAGGEVEECPQCGWYTDYLDSTDDGEEMCNDCIDNYEPL